MDILSRFFRDQGAEGSKKNDAQKSEEREASVGTVQKDATSESSKDKTVATFGFGASVPLDGEVLIGDCTDTSGDPFAPCEWQIQRAKEKGSPKFRVMF
jgi:hypothetical protein